MSDRGNDDDPRNEGDDVGAQDADNLEDAMEAILRDPAKKAALLERMGLGDRPGTSTGEHSHPTPSGKSTGGLAHYSHSTPSGKSMGGWSSYPPVPFW